MGSSEGSRTSREAHAQSGTPDEHARLNEVMDQADEWLIQSLHKDEQSRRRRRWRIIGGIAMLIALVSALLLFFPAGTKNTTTRTAVDVAGASRLTQEGWKALNASNPEEAVHKFEKAVKLDPQSPNAWNGLGWGQFNSGNRPEAEKAFQQCLKLDAAQPAAMNGLGQIYFLQRDEAKAEKYLLGAAKRQASAAYYTLTRLYLLQGKYADARTWAEKVVKEQPKDEVARRMLEAAKAGKLDDNLRKQIEPPVQAKQTASGDETRQGWMFLQQGENKRAIETFVKALEKNSKDVAALNGLGWGYLNTAMADGDEKAKWLNEAVPCFQRCIRMEPQHIGAMNGLARSLKALGRTDEAIAIWEKGIQAASSPAESSGLRLGLAETYAETGKYAQAVKLYEELVKIVPDNPQIKEALESAKKQLAEKK